MERTTDKHKKRQRGVSLPEILMALLILAVAVLPAVGAFTRYYGVATRQMDQEIALKLGEAVINVLMTVNYTRLSQGMIPNIPLNVQLPSGAYTGSLNFSGMEATGTSIVIGKVDYRISASVTPVFRAQNIDVPHFDALEFKFYEKLPGPGGAPPGEIATYSCFDDLLAINVSVKYGPGAPIRLSTFRTDMTN